MHKWKNAKFNYYIIQYKLSDMNHVHDQFHLFDNLDNNHKQ